MRAAARSACGTEITQLTERSFILCGVGTSSRLIAGLVLGAVWGALSSFTNAEASPFGVAAALVLNAGWAWAGIAVAAGWVVGTAARGAAAGVLALFAMTTAYYAMDSILRYEPFGSYWYEMRVWWLASLVFGAVLGAIGGSIRRPGLVGLLAGLTVPVGATVEMILLPREGAAFGDVNPVYDWLRPVVWAVAAVVTAGLVARFLADRRRNNVDGAGGSFDTPLTTSTAPSESPRRLLR